MSQAGPHFKFRVDNEVIRFAPFAIVVFDEQDVVEIANSEALRILAGGSEPPEIVGCSLSSVFPGVDFSGVGQDSLSSIAADGKHSALELQCVKVGQDGRFQTIVYLSQVGGRRQRELLLEKEACTDELSGLANRRAFQRTMENNQHRPLSLAIVDIDHFKLVNDRLGHPTGDFVIERVGSQLQESFGENAILVSRMGGDEFSILFETVDAELIVEALNDFREKIFRSELPNSESPNSESPNSESPNSESPNSESLQQGGLSVSVSIGVAISTRRPTSPRRLLTVSDQQLYVAKHGGRNQVAHVLIE